MKRSALARAVLGGHPQHRGALHLLGLALLIQKRPREAVGPLTEAARDSADPLLETHYALALRDVGRKDEAITWLEPRDQPPARIRAGLPRAWPHPLRPAPLRRSRSDPQARDRARAISIGSLRRARRCLYLQRRSANAKVAFARALALAPGYVRALHGFGTALLLEGECERAAEQFRRVLAHRPDHLRARLDLAHCLLELGQFEAGVAELRTIVRAAPRCYGNALKMLASSRRGRLWLRPSVAASFLQAVDFLNSTNGRADHGDLE
jgi:tetratricopeptide (TPR) repeat protein